MKSANGVLILVLGILSWVMFGFLTGLPAWIMGNNALRDIDAGVADPSERSMVQIGRILGMIATILTILGVCFAILVVVGALGVFGLAASSAPPR
jgi:hypothetical protein